MKQAARWTVLVALFTIPFLPLYVASEFFFPFITGKNFVFRILVEVASVAYVLLALMDRRYRPKLSLVLVLFGALVAWMAVANLLSVQPVKAFWSNFERMDGWATLVHLFAFFLVSSAVLGVDKLWRRWWIFFVSVAAAVCLYGLVQLSGGAEIHQGGIRLTATFGNAIYLAVYLMFSFIVAAFLIIRSKGFLRTALIGFLGLSVLILFFTASRGPLIGLMAGVSSAAVLWLFLSYKDWKGGTLPLGIKLAAGTLVVLVLLAGSLFLARESSVVTSNTFLSRAASVFSLGQELKVRSTIWGLALEGANEDLLTGWGQEGFNQVFNEYYKPSLYGQETWFDRAHNMYLDWLIAGGIPALLLFVAILIAGMISLLRAPNLSRAERVLLLSALVAYAVQALVVFDNLFSYVPLVMLLAMAHDASAKSIEPVERAPELVSESYVGITTAALTVLVVVVVWSVNIPSMRAANHLIHAVSPQQKGVGENISFFKKALEDGTFATQEVREQLVMFAAETATNTKVPESLRSELAVLALEEMRKEVEMSPNDARLRVQYASAFEAAGDDISALAEIERAIELSPKKQSLHINKAYKLYELERFAEAKEAYLYAYQLGPEFEQLAISAGAGIILTGDIEAGKAVLLEALGTTTPSSDSLFYAYYHTKQWKDLEGVARAQVTASGGTPESRYRLAQALAAGNRFEEARAEVLATMTEHPETRATGQDLLNRMPPAR